MVSPELGTDWELELGELVVSPELASILAWLPLFRHTPVKSSILGIQCLTNSIIRNMQENACLFPFPVLFLSRPVPSVPPSFPVLAKFLYIRSN